MNNHTVDLELVTNETRQAVQVLEVSKVWVVFELNGKRHRVPRSVAEANRGRNNSTIRLIPRITTAAACLSADRNGSSERDALTGSSQIVAPMPGIIVNLPVQVGALVTKGQTVLVIEAMKMENPLTAHADCIVEEILVNKGQEVSSKQLLVKLKPA